MAEYQLSNLNSKAIGTKGQRAIILLHGWRQSLQALTPLGELLAANSEVHLLDLPGFGESPLSDETWGTEEYARLIVRYIESQNLPKVTIVGHSFGGKVASIVAKLRPDLLSSLVLIGASTLPRRRAFNKRIQHFYIKWLGKCLKFLEKVLGVKAYTNYFIPKYASLDYRAADRSLQKTFVRIVNENLERQVKGIETPTLLLWGQDDTETPPEIAHRLKKLLPNSFLVELENKGHEPFLDTGSHLCAYYIREFLKELPPALFDTASQPANLLHEEGSI